MSDDGPPLRRVAARAVGVVALLLSGTVAANVPQREQGSDPTRPLGPAAVAGTAGAAMARPALHSVLIGADRRVAVIDGRRMGEGEEYNGIKVWQILPEGVVVSVNGSPRMLLELGNAGARAAGLRKEWR